MIVFEFPRGLSHKDLKLLGKKYCVNIQKTMTCPYHNTTHELFWSYRKLNICWTQNITVCPVYLQSFHCSRPCWIGMIMLEKLDLIITEHPTKNVK